MDAPHPPGATPPDPDHPPTNEAPLTFRLGKPINGHARSNGHAQANGHAHNNGHTAANPAEGPTTPQTSSEAPHAVGPTDPRWVLAIRTREALDGDAVPPQQQQKLIRLGALLGLTEQQVRHIVRAVQDQARRGFAPSAMELLGHLPPAADAAAVDTAPLDRRRVIRLAAFWSALVLLVELAIIFAVVL